MIDHNVHRPIPAFEKGERRLKRCPCSLPIKRRQNDQTGMEFTAANQSPEIPRVFGNDDPVLGDAPLDDTMIRFAAPADVKRMNGIVASRRIEPCRQLRRQALIDEQLHSASPKDARRGALSGDGCEHR